MGSFDFESLRQEPLPESCSGIFYRGRENIYVNFNGGFTYDVRFLPLKRKSCPGCDVCAWIQEMMRDDPLCVELPEIKHGGLYELKVTGTNTDWESGIVDEVYIGFVLIKEKTDE